jgi:hypothetical protein
MSATKMNKKFYIVGPHNCPARRIRACLMSGEKCHMMSGVQCIFFHYELLERKRQLRLQKHKKEKGEK